MEGREGGWTVVLLRKGGLRSWSWNLDRLPVLLVLAGVALVLVAAGFGLGLGWSAIRGSAREARLEARMDSLTDERGMILALAAQLDSVDTAYRRLQRVMGGEVASSDRDVQLPPDEPGGPAPAAAGSASAPGAAPAADTYDWPLAQRGFVTRGHQEGASGPTEGHPGIDIAVPTGSYVRASAGGRVTEAGEDDVYGKYVRIEHGGGVRTLYAHNLWLFVHSGDSVARDEVIALSGNTGRSTAPHLHFEVTKAGRAVDPARLLRSPGG